MAPVRPVAGAKGERERGGEGERERGRDGEWERGRERERGGLFLMSEVPL